MICPRRTVVIALSLHFAAAVGVRTAEAQAPPRYPLTQQLQQYNMPVPPTAQGVQPRMPEGSASGSPRGAFPPDAGARPPGPAPPDAAVSPPGPMPDPRLASVPQRSAAQRAPTPAPDIFAPTQVVARVGSQAILAGELLGPINQALEPYLPQIPPDQLPQQRALLMQKMLPTVIDTKMVYLDFLREIPRERLPDVQKQIFDQFDEMQLPKVIAKAGVSTPAELDRKLRGYGSSLYKTKRQFLEQVLAHQMVQRSIDRDPKINLDELREYYQQHIDEYSTEAQARWEQLMVRWDRFDSREAARQALAEMGNEVLRGAPLAAVARHKSQGFTAEQGGYHDWTVQGSLVSKPLDENLFTLPIGRLSQIIADDRGLHIIRVIERHESSVVPFKTSPTMRIANVTIGPHERTPTQTLVVVQVENSAATDEAVETTVYVRGAPIQHKKSVVPGFGISEFRFELENIDPNDYTEEDFKVDIEAQARIRAVIRQEKVDKQREEYLEKLRQRTPVWTVFDVTKKNTEGEP